MAKRALGKGLEAFISTQSYVEEVEDTTGEKLVSVDILKIDVNQNQPRHNFNKEKLEELAESIKEHGIIQPLILKKTGNRYLIVAGERRYRAARLAGLKEVPAVLKDINDQELMQIALIENIQREDLNEIEEAEAIKELMKEYSLNQEDVSKILGKSRSAIANSVRLLNLSAAAKKALTENSITAGHARALLGLKDKKEQDKVLEYIIEKDLTVREVEAYVSSLLNPQPTEKNKKIKDQETERIEKIFRDALQTKVKIKGDLNKGKVEIEYYSKEELENIYLLINKRTEEE